MIVMQQPRSKILSDGYDYGFNTYASATAVLELEAI
jgi:hypothetical protein